MPPGPQPDLLRRIGARVRALRVEKGLTQERLAWDCDLDKGYVSQIESGKRAASYPVLFAIAARLEVEAADLIGFAVRRPRLALLDAARRGDAAAVQAALAKLELK